MKRKTQEEFIKDAIKVHGNKFDYSLTEYKTVKNKIKIKCSEGHIFEQTPNDHLNGHGCKICHGWGKYFESNDLFINKLKEINNNTLDFSKTHYNGWDNKVTVKCFKHGYFERAAGELINKKAGCPKCGRERTGDKNRGDKEIFIKKAKLIHNNFYDYSKTEYIDANTKIEILCYKHGIFTQTPKDHINQSHGCPSCNSSKGEKIISNVLKELNINFNQQHKFKKCFNKRKLPFDFYLPDYDICIEYDGEQHFMPVEKFGGINSFNKIKKNDIIKNEFCKKNNITLIRINYKQIKNIKKIIQKYV
jgi:very-short-patch-repair endonuclease